MVNKQFNKIIKPVFENSINQNDLWHFLQPLKPIWDNFINKKEWIETDNNEDKKKIKKCNICSLIYTSRKRKCCNRNDFSTEELNIKEINSFPNLKKIDFSLFKKHFIYHCKQQYNDIDELINKILGFHYYLEEKNIKLNDKEKIALEEELEKDIWIGNIENYRLGNILLINYLR
jgi:hypothetical protein